MTPTKDAYAPSKIDIDLINKPEKELVLADTLLRALLSETNEMDFGFETIQK